MEDRLAEASLRLEVDVPPDIGAFVADGKRVRQVLTVGSEIVQIPALELAYGGGGIHSFTLPQPLGTAAKGPRYEVGATYPPSGVTAPRAQWKSVVVP